MADVIIESRYDFRDVTVPEKLLEIKVSGETVSAEMDRAALRFATIEPTDSPIRQGDFVRVELPGQTVQINVGNDFADEALEDALPGMCQGDERVLSLNGSEAAVRILSVKRRMIPQLTDDLVQKLGLEGTGTVQDYREYIVRQIAERAKQQKLQILCDYVAKAAVEKSVFSPVDKESGEYRMLWNGLMKQLEEQAAATGRSPEQVLAQALRMDGKPVEDCWEALRKQCAEQIKLCAMGKTYASEDGVSYTRETVRKRYQDYAGQTGMDPNQIPDEILDSGMINLYIEYFSQKIAGYYLDKFQTELVR